MTGDRPRREPRGRPRDDPRGPRRAGAGDEPPRGSAVTPAERFPADAAAHDTPAGAEGASDGPAELSTADYQALARFRHALRVFLRFSEQAAREAGLTPNQHQLLLAVRGWAGPGEAPTIRDLADQLQLEHHSVVELVDRAVAAGLVHRHTDPDDRRRQRLMLTPHGARQLAVLTAAHREELRRFRGEMARILDEIGAVDTVDAADAAVADESTVADEAAGATDAPARTDADTVDAGR
ncbi:MAG TPA: MarR family winged helix-turn-helix transcriptional regulator [Acidimicrobiales bacterium]